MTLQSSFHRFLLLLHPNKKEVYQIYTYAIFKGIITLSLPLGIQSIINLIQGGRISSSWILLVLIVIVGILFSGIMQIMQMRITENIQQRIFTKAAFDFSVRIPKVKFESIYRHYAPELMNRFFDVLTLQKGIAKLLIDFSSSSLQIIFGLVLLSLYHSFFIAFGLLLIVLAYITIAFTAPKGLSSSIQESKYKYRVAFWLEELARAKDSFKLSGKTDLHIKNTDKEVINYLKSREHHFSILKSQYIMLLAFKIVIALALLVVGGILVLDQKMNIGQFIAAEIIILLIIESTEKLMLSLETVYDVFTSLEKIGQITDLDVDSNTGSIQFFDAKSSAFSVQSKGVSYTYPGMNKKILNNINFNIQSNETACITGFNGSGKSTLLHLIAGLYIPQQGTISINHLPISNYRLENLYQYFGNALAEESLFEGTLHENITLGRGNITTDTLRWAIEKTGLTDYIQELPYGLDTPVDANGRKLSKSTIQKILIARSVINKPKLLLFENNIDCIIEKEKKKIIDFITDPQNGWTLIAISNDPYFMEKCQTILCIENGEIKLFRSEK